MNLPLADRPFEPRPILPPADPTAAAAYRVLEKHCARCHQGGRSNGPAPAAAFGNVLRLDELAESPQLVRPGNPDASRLYVMMLRRLMPLDDHLDATGQPGPTSSEIAAVRAWISSLPEPGACRDRRIVTIADHAAALAQLGAGTTEDRSMLRFLSLAHLHNGCVRFETLAAYRQAIVRLFNSLSWKPDPIAVPPIDVSRTLFKINLNDLGWLPEHWERIMRSGADPLGLTPVLPVAARQPFGTTVPVARADWFAETVLNSPLYYDVLGLPGTGPEILKILQIDATGSLESGRGLRVGVKPSMFASQPSLLERLSGRTGAFWQAYHRFARDAAVDLPAFVDMSVSEPVPLQASRIMFTLPNGLPAFYVVGQRGDRLDSLPPEIALPSSATHGEIRGGLDCLACHRSGPAERDTANLPRPAADAIASDRRAVAGALRRIGIDPALTLDGVEPLVALAREYVKPLDGFRAAAEAGVEWEDLARLADQEGPASVLARRLVQGLVVREEVEARARDLLTALGRTLPEPIVESAGVVAAKAASDFDYKPIDPGPGLVLYSDKIHYRKGDLLQLAVRVSADCHLTLISIDQRGRGTVLFPSDFETNTLVTAGRELRLPGSGAPYAFRLNEPGRETIVALCNEAGAVTDGIRHDFEKQRFTDLGNYAEFVVQNALADAGPDDPSVRRPEQRQRFRRRPKLDNEPEKLARPEQISRTAIGIAIE